MARKDIFDLSGKVALITGGGSGIGRAYCEEMAEFGADVACNDIICEKAQETVKLLDKYGYRAIVIIADASNEAEISNMVETTVKELGSVDIVFANSALLDTRTVRIHEMSIEEWDRIFSLNLRGTFLLMRAVFPVMMRKKSGCFISTASEAGVWPLPTTGPFYMTAAYNTAKAGVIILTKHAAKQYGEYGIRANIICLGYHRTPFIPAEVREKLEELIIGASPLKRIGLPEDIKGLAVYLATDASSYATGQVFIENVGFVA